MPLYWMKPLLQPKGWRCVSHFGNSLRFERFSFQKPVIRRRSPSLKPGPSRLGIEVIVGDHRTWDFQHPCFRSAAPVSCDRRTNLQLHDLYQPAP